MIKYIIPDSNRTREINFFLFELMAKHKEMFYDNVKVEGCYGILADTIWSGGRFDLGGSFTHRDSVVQVIDAYNKFGVTYSYTFSNLFTIPEHLIDPWGNEQLKAGKNKNIAAIVATDVMADYIKEKYPYVKLVSSVTRGVLTKGQLLELLKDDKFDIVVTNTHLNNVIEKIVPKEFRPKCEILVNDCCPGTCPRHQHCYENNSKLALCEEMDMSDLPCKNTAKFSMGNNPNPDYNEAWDWFWKFNDNKDFQWILQKEKEGFQYFKLNGRNIPPEDVVRTYAIYFVKKEYQLDFVWLMFNKVEYLRGIRGTMLYEYYKRTEGAVNEDFIK